MQDDLDPRFWFDVKSFSWIIFYVIVIILNFIATNLIITYFIITPNVITAIRLLIFLSTITLVIIVIRTLEALNNNHLIFSRRAMIVGTIALLFFIANMYIFSIL